MNTQAAIRQARKETGKARTVARRGQVARRETERREAEQAFAALLASRAESQNVTAY